MQTLLENPWMQTEPRGGSELCWAKPLLPHLPLSSALFADAARGAGASQRLQFLWQWMWGRQNCGCCSGLVISHVGLGRAILVPAWAAQCGTHPSRCTGLQICAPCPTATGVPWPSKSCCGYLTWQLKALGLHRTSSFLIYQRLWVPCPPQQLLKG